MKIFTLIALCLMLVLSSVNLSAQDPLAGKKMSDVIPNDPTVLYGKLENGITYYIKENKKPEKRADLQILVKAGSLDEADDQEGLAHFVEHMAFNGTKTYPKNELVSFFEKIGMSFGGDLNASTDFDRTYYVFKVPTNDKKTVEQGFQVLEDWLHNMTFDSTELEKERGVIHEEWRVYRGAQDRADRKHYPIMLYNSKWAKRLPIGDTTDILHTPRQRFLDFYNTWYRPNQTAIIAVGDFKKDDILKLIKKKFGKLQNPANFVERPTFPIPLDHQLLTSVFVDKEWSMPPYFQIYYKLPERGEQTYGDYKRQLSERLISAMLTQRLNEYMQKPDGPFAFYAGGDAGSFYGNVFTFTLSCLAKQDKILEAYTTLLAEGFRAQQHGFTEGELKRAKADIVAGFDEMYNERDKIESERFADEYYTNYMKGTSFPGIIAEKTIYDKYVPEITLPELNSMMKDLVNTNSVVVTFSALDSPDLKVPTESELKLIYNMAKQIDYTPYVDKTVDKPLMAKIPTPGKVVKEELIKEIDAVKWTLSNGAEVYLKKTDFKNDEIMMNAYAPGGLSVLNSADYRNASHSTSIINESGIAEFDNVELQKLLTGKRVGVSPSISELTRGFNGTTVPKDLETFMQLVNLYITNPRKDAEAFEIYKKNAIDMNESQQKEPQTALMDTFSVTLYKNNPFRMPETKKELENLNLDKAFNFYKSQFDGVGQFKFFFVGAIDFTEMKKMVETYIASLPAGTPKVYKDNNIRMAKGEIFKKVYKGVDPKATFYLAMPGELEYTYENVFAMNALSELLDIRLREEVREEKGGTYGISVWSTPNHFPFQDYKYNVYFTTAPEKLEDLILTIKKVFTDIKSGNFKADNVDKIKELLTRKRETDKKENSFWLGTMYSRIYNEQPFTVVNDYDKYVKAITKESLVKTANTFLNEKNWIQVVLYPEAMKK
ncbi:MAG: insulinase family protein [bacterium]